MLMSSLHKWHAYMTMVRWHIISWTHMLLTCLDNTCWHVINNIWRLQCQNILFRAWLGDDIPHVVECNCYSWPSHLLRLHGWSSYIHGICGTKLDNINDINIMLWIANEEFGGQNWLSRAWVSDNITLVPHAEWHNSFIALIPEPWFNINMSP